jgi:tryptophan-rich sensory protein
MWAFGITWHLSFVVDGKSSHNLWQGELKNKEWQYPMTNYCGGQ